MLEELYKTLDFITHLKNLRYFICEFSIKSSDDTETNIGWIVRQNRAATIILNVEFILAEKHFDDYKEYTKFTNWINNKKTRYDLCF